MYKEICRESEKFHTENYKDATKPLLLKQFIATNRSPHCDSKKPVYTDNIDKNQIQVLLSNCRVTNTASA